MQCIFVVALYIAVAGLRLVNSSSIFDTGGLFCLVDLFAIQEVTCMVWFGCVGKSKQLDFIKIVPRMAIMGVYCARLSPHLVY